MVIYVAGPMTGRPEFNFPAFREAAQHLRRCGHKVISPVELDDLEGFDPAGDGSPLDKETYAEFLQRDLSVISKVDAIACLPGWEGSKGALVEVAFARSLNIRVLDYPTLNEIGSGEVRVTNPDTGGEKGTKPARFGLLPWDQLWKVAELYGSGAEKYADDNWRRGYAWHLSADALGRHFAQFMAGELDDPETNSPHLSSVVFHALALMYFTDAHPDLNDLWLHN